MKQIVVHIPTPEFPRRLLIGIQDGYCNLKCPMCFVHSPKNKHNAGFIKGLMPLKAVCGILDEVKSAKPVITPNLWSEPLMIKDFGKYMASAKERGLPVVINTNGLLLTDKLARFMVDIKIDSFIVSLDAMTEKTLLNTRGVAGIKKVKKAVFTMLKARGSKAYPRIGTSFVINKNNRHEKNKFISYWLRYVDVVRVNETYGSDGSVKNADLPEKRVPCQALYDTMVINHKGDVSICCLDGFYKTKLGNVLKDGVRKVWLGRQFRQIRNHHETARYDRVPLCKNCGVWSNYIIEDVKADGILIRKAPLITHYNRIDRLDTWKAGR